MNFRREQTDNKSKSRPRPWLVSETVLTMSYFTLSDKYTWDMYVTMRPRPPILSTQIPQFPREIPAPYP